MSEPIVSVRSYPGFFPQDVVPTDIHHDKNREWACIGFVIALIIISFVLQLPGILGGSIVYAGGLVGLLMVWGMLFAPLIILGVMIGWAAGRRKRQDTDD